MKRLFFVMTTLIILGSAAWGQTEQASPPPVVDYLKNVPLPPSSFWHNDHLKTVVHGDQHILHFGDDQLSVTGIWLPDSGDPSRARLFPEQGRITCIKSEKVCKELLVTLGPDPVSVTIDDVDETDYDIVSWDKSGLTATLGPFLWSTKPADRCLRHVLTMDFQSNAVLLTDIPTHVKGCEAISSTDTYRLVWGNYSIETPKPDSPKDTNGNAGKR